MSIAIQNSSTKVENSNTYLLTGDRRQAKHFRLAKQFCFLDADCFDNTQVSTEY